MKFKFVPISTEALKKLRSRSGMGQREFWAQFGVTQSGGSRYEAGKVMPKTVTALIHLMKKQKDKSLNFSPVKNQLKLRSESKLNQTKFWAQFGVTQSGGSRYETRGRLPKALNALIRLKYNNAK